MPRIPSREWLEKVAEYLGKVFGAPATAVRELKITSPALGIEARGWEIALRGPNKQAKIITDEVGYGYIEVVKPALRRATRFAAWSFDAKTMQAWLSELGFEDQEAEVKPPEEEYRALWEWIRLLDGIYYVGFMEGAARWSSLKKGVMALAEYAMSVLGVDLFDKARDICRLIDKRWVVDAHVRIGEMIDEVADELAKRVGPISKLKRGGGPEGQGPKGSSPGGSSPKGERRMPTAGRVRRRVTGVEEFAELVS